MKRSLVLMAAVALVRCAGVAPLDVPDYSRPPGRIAGLRADVTIECARLALEQALAGLRLETWLDHPQLRLPNEPPLQMFPRLVTPAFAGGCDEKCGAAWYVPLIFEFSEETTWPTRQPKRGLDLREILSFWLEASRTERAGAIPDPPKDKDPKADTYDPWARGGARRPGQLFWVPPEWVLSAQDDLHAPIDRPGVHAWVIVVPRKHEREGPAIDPGYYWLRLVPRMPEAKRIGDGDLDGEVLLDVAIADGHLRSIKKLLPPPTTAPSAIPVERLRTSDTIKELFRCDPRKWRLGLDRCRFPLKHFWKRLWALQRSLSAADPADAERMSDLRGALLAWIENRFPAGVNLDDPKECDQPFSFIVGADVQNSRDRSGFRRFLRIASGSRRLERDEAFSQEKLRDELRSHRSHLEFVVFAGDLADGQARSDLGAMAFNVLGIYPPISPYEDEYPALAKEILRFDRPFVAVPGNHDGFAGFPGIINWLVVGFGAKSRTLDRANDYVPVLLKPPLPLPIGGTPRYDGHAEWLYALGALDYVFPFRGQTIAGLNSFRLAPRERASVGSVAMNWGGGLRSEDVEWLRGALRSKVLRTPGAHQFLYMHHDPRAGTPLKATNAVDRYGIYDNTDNWVSLLTAGHFGLGHSPYTDFYLPLITPAAHHVSRLIDDRLNGRERPQQEWMRRTGPDFGLNDDGDHNFYAGELIELINGTLAPELEGGVWKKGEGPYPGGLSHLFFGHNDVPLGAGASPGHWAPPGYWVWTSRADGRAIFPEVEGGEWEGSEFHSFTDRPPFPKWPLRQLFKIKNDEPPDWAKRMRPIPGNAAAIRLDDLAYPGGTHGFHVVTVDPCDRKPDPKCDPKQGLCPRKPDERCVPEIHTTWIPLPSEPER